MAQDICLFSSEGKEDHLNDVLKSIRAEDTRYMVLSEVLGQTHLAAATRGTNSRAQLFPASSIATWSMAVANLLQRDMDPNSRKVLIDVDFAVARKLTVAAFLERAADHDFFAASGRFDTDTGAFVFPTWECCVIAPALWQDDEFKVFLGNISNGLKREDQLYAERYFFEHFRRSFDIASLIGGQTAFDFDPVNAGRMNLAQALEQGVPGQA